MYPLIRAAANGTVELESSKQLRAVLPFAGYKRKGNTTKTGRGAREGGVLHHIVDDMMWKVAC